MSKKEQLELKIEVIDHILKLDRVFFDESPSSFGSAVSCDDIEDYRSDLHFELEQLRKSE